jgi:hypothetical protein
MGDDSARSASISFLFYFIFGRTHNEDPDYPKTHNKRKKKAQKERREKAQLVSAWNTSETSEENVKYLTSISKSHKFETPKMAVLHI